MKILKRNFEQRNVIIFMIFSFVYLQAIYALSKGLSFYSPESLKAMIFEHGLFAMMVAFSIYLIIKVKKHSDKILLVTLFLIAGKNFILLSGSFNKLILALNFLYLVFAFYFFVIWELQINKASFNPNFSTCDLEKASRFKIEGRLNDSEKNCYNVLITNIDDHSCFVYLPKEHKLNSKLLRDVSLQAEYEGVLFEQDATVVSTYGQGLGLEFKGAKNKKINRPSWSDLYKICLERGFFT